MVRCALDAVISSKQQLFVVGFSAEMRDGSLKLTAIGGDDPNISCGFVDGLSERAHAVNRFISAVVGSGYTGNGEGPSPRETVLHFLIFDSQASQASMAFHPYPLSGDSGLPAGRNSLAGSDNVGDVAFVSGPRKAEEVFSPLKKEPSPRKKTAALVSCALVKKSVVPVSREFAPP